MHRNRKTIVSSLELITKSNGKHFLLENNLNDLLWINVYQTCSGPMFCERTARNKTWGHFCWVGEISSSGYSENGTPAVCLSFYHPAHAVAADHVHHPRCTHNCAAFRTDISP